MTGNWQCLTIKASGLGALVVYDWFECKITNNGSCWMLEKLRGSQHTKSSFYTDGDTRLIYLKFQIFLGEKTNAYDPGPGTEQIGYAFRSGSADWHIECTAPKCESKLDIIKFCC